MSAWRTIFAGMLGLALLDATVSSNDAAGRAGGLLDSVGTVIEHLLSPTVPAIPDLRTHGGDASGDLLGRVDPSSSAGGSAGGSLLPADWTTSPPKPAATPPTQIYA